MGINEGLFTDGCKKIQKLVQNAIPKTLFPRVQEEELRDIIVMNAIVGLVQNDDLKTYKKSFSKSMFTKDEYSKI